MWYVGQLVVCVDASPCTVTGKTSHLVEDKIYTIKSIHKTPKGDLGFALVGVPDDTGKIIANRRGTNIKSGGLKSERFRPVVSDKHEACDEDFILSLKKSADRRVPVKI